jgi:hypothetical protein
MKAQLFLTALLMILVGCNQSPTPSPSETQASSPSPITSAQPEASPTSPTASAPAQTSPTTSPTASAPAQVSPTASSTASKQLSPPASADFTITPGSIGQAKVGMTVGQLKKVLAGKAQFQVKSPFIVDFDALAIVQSGKEQYYILYPAGVPLADSDVIEALITNNPNYRTAQGVGPGTPLTQAEAVYGDATLSYNLANESREYVKFAKQPSKNLSFRLGAANDDSLAGIYPSQKGENNQTKEFKKTASLRFVEVYCGQNCPLPAP